MMHGWVNVGLWTVHPLQPTRPTFTHQNTFHTCKSQTATFHPGYQNANERFLRQTFKINYNWVPQGDHGTERVKFSTRIYIALQIGIIQ